MSDNYPPGITEDTISHHMKTLAPQETKLRGISRIPEDANEVEIVVKKVLDQGLSILVVQAGNRCPINDHPICQNVHWRQGVGFEGERRCPHHDFSWTPGEWLSLALEGDVVDPAQVRPCICEECPVAKELQSPNDYTNENKGCHSDDLEGMTPPGICRGLAIAQGWIGQNLIVKKAKTATAKISLISNIRTWFLRNPELNVNKMISVDFNPKPQ